MIISALLGTVVGNVMTIIIVIIIALSIIVLVLLLNGKALKVPLTFTNPSTPTRLMPHCIAFALGVILPSRALFKRRAFSRHELLNVGGVEGEAVHRPTS